MIRIEYSPGDNTYTLIQQGEASILLTVEEMRDLKEKIDKLLL